MNGVGSQDPWPLNIVYWPPLIYCEHILLTPNFNSGQSSCMSRLNGCFFMHVFVWKSERLFQDFRIQINIGYIAYTRMIDLKFEISKNCWGGAHRAPLHRPLPRSFSDFALDSSIARFRPPTFDAWLSHYHAWGRDLQMLMSSIRWMNAQKLSI